MPLNHLGNHAIVIGGSMAGLLATRILADYYQQVTLVERDAFRPWANTGEASRKDGIRMDCWRAGGKFWTSFSLESQRIWWPAARCRATSSPKGGGSTKAAA